MDTILVTLCFTVLIGIIPFNSAQSTDCSIVAGAKTFCTDTTAWRTWFEAGMFCRSRGWDLASIQNDTEVTALLSAYDNATFFGDYWINGRDIQAHEQFVWDYHSATRSGKLDVRIHTFLPPVRPTVYQTCLVYSSLPTGSGLGYWPCANPLATLCERPT